MMLYANGKVPETVVSVVLGSGHDSKGRYWEHRLTPAMAERWEAAVEYAQRKWGRTMRIRSGANAYRNLAWQTIARADACAAGNCNGASVVGYSSHGGNWRGRDCLAIDVNPNGLTWAQVWEACRAGGFECGLITEAISGIPGGEPWHVIDFAAFAAPAGGGAQPFPPEKKPTPQDRNGTMNEEYYRKTSTGQIGVFAVGVKIFGTAEDYQRFRVIRLNHKKLRPEIPVIIPPEAKAANFVGLSDADWATMVAIHGGTY